MHVHGQMPTQQLCVSNSELPNNTASAVLAFIEKLSSFIGLSLVLRQCIERVYGLGPQAEFQAFLEVSTIGASTIFVYLVC